MSKKIQIILLSILFMLLLVFSLSLLMTKAATLIGKETEVPPAIGTWDDDAGVYKIKDKNNNCYVVTRTAGNTFSTAISCVKDN